MAIHASLLAHFAALAAKHPESAELYRALPYVLEFCVLVWVLYTFALKSLRDQFRALSDFTVRDHQTPVAAELEADVDDQGIFQAPNGDWMQLTYDRRGKVNGSERVDPPKTSPSTLERTASGGFRLGRFS
jgi:hypothetical protein